MPRTLDFSDFDPAEIGVTAAFNAALTACAELEVGELYFDKRYLFLSKPNPITTALRPAMARDRRQWFHQPASRGESSIDAREWVFDEDSKCVVGMRLFVSASQFVKSVQVRRRF